MYNNREQESWLNICFEELFIWSREKRRKWTKSLKKEEREALRKQMVELNLHLEIAKFVTTFFQDDVIHAHYFVADVCESCRCLYYTIIRWEPNETLQDRRPIHDWRAKYLCGAKCRYSNRDSEIWHLISRWFTHFLHYRWFSPGEIYNVLCNWCLLSKLSIWRSA